MSPKPEKTVTDRIKATISGLPSSVFLAADLVAQHPDVSRELLDQVLFRMLKEGKLERVQRGYYRRVDLSTEPEAITKKGSEPAAPSARPVDTNNLPRTASLIWNAAEIIRGDYKPHEYGTVILPFTVMRRLDCVLAPTKVAVLDAAKKYAKSDVDPSLFLEKAAGGLKFWNTSNFDFAKLTADSAGIKKNMLDYVGGFSESVRDIFDYYKTIDLINDLDRKKLLFNLVQTFASVNLHPDVVNNADMGQAFEELIRRFNEQSNETAGEHYTPRDAIRLAVELLFATDEDTTLSQEHRIVKLYDPTAGTGGMLSVAEEHLKTLNSTIDVLPYGQELNEQTYAVCKADMVIKGQDIGKIALGNTLSNDAFPNEKFDYMLSNPPYGVDWKKVKDDVETEHRKLGFKGRFGPGLPRISDGQTLFLLHLVSKMHPKDSGETSRIGIVMNGSPLFTGGAGSGESEIRRYVIENDLLEAIVALPTDMFYNTGISTYIWILSNKKERRRIGKVQLINAATFFEKTRKSLGSKRREFSPDNIRTIAALYSDFKENEHSKIFVNEYFGYSTITVERPLRLNFKTSPERLARLAEKKVLTSNGLDLAHLRTALETIDAAKTFKTRHKFESALNVALKKANIHPKPPQKKAVLEALSERDETADICTDAKGNPEADSDLRDTENVSLGEDIHDYFKREVTPFVPDAWINESKTEVGYDIPFTRCFYHHIPPRPLSSIDADVVALTSKIVAMLDKATI